MNNSHTKKSCSQEGNKFPIDADLVIAASGSSETDIENVLKHQK